LARRVRILARRDAAGVRLYTRSGSDFSKRFPLIVTAIAVHCSHTP
jgi:ATP-dependent DNA ligase